MDKLLEEGRNFLREIKPSDKVALIYHNDIDGIISAAIFYIALEKLGIKFLKTLPMSIKEFDKKFTRKIKNFDVIIVLDIAVEKKIKPEKKTLIIDHHPTKKIYDKKVLHINPRFIKPEIYQPASYILYKLFKNFLNIEQLEWLSVIGTLGDYGFRDCKDLLKKWVAIKKKDEIFRSRFGKIAISLNSAIYFLGFDKTLKILISSKKLSDLTRNKKIIYSNKKYKKILKSAEKYFWKNAEKIENFLIYSKIDKKYKKIGSALATKIASKFPNNFIMVIEKNRKYKISARYEEGKLHVGNILKKCCKNLGKGGGHRESGGASVGKLDVFIQRLIKEIKNFSKRNESI
jgi:single-stranded DNA-specific DHH superfamily exonuclease